MSTIISSVIKLFFIDLAIFTGFIILMFFCFLVAQAIKNGREHNITDEKIFVYSLKAYPIFLGKHLKNLLSWGIILFIIHIFVSLFGTFSNYIREVGTYDNNPLLAFFIDAVEAIIPIFTPFIIPAIVVIAVLILGYGFIATLHQVYKDEIENEKMLKLLETAENQELTEQYFQSDKKEPYKPTGKQLFFYFCENTQKAFFKISKILPKLMIIIAICIGVNSIFLSIKNVTQIVENQKAIQELHMTIKNLSKSEGLARITLLNEERTPSTIYPLKTYRIEILDYNGDPIKKQTQEITLRGNEIFIDAININFEYSEIAQGEKFNIAYPYRIYSETMAPHKGIQLTCMYENGKNYPVIYSLDSSEIYGMKENVYFNRLSELFDTIKDENMSREMGIRSIVGVANHFTMKKNEIRDIFIEGTGGISVKKHESLFDESNSIELELD